MNNTDSELRRPSLSSPQAADQSQRTTSLGDAGTTGRNTLAGHHPARSSLAGRGSSSTAAFTDHHQAGLTGLIYGAWLVYVVNVIALVVLL